MYVCIWFGHIVYRHVHDIAAYLLNVDGSLCITNIVRICTVVCKYKDVNYVWKCIYVLLIV